jgi:tetratricopeptide (TPR) repeat protein
MIIRSEGLVSRLAWKTLFLVAAGVATTPIARAADNSSAGEHYALLVGVRQYSKAPELRRLPYTENDVNDLAGVLQDNGYRKENVVLMTQKIGAEDVRFLPLKEHILNELHLLLDSCGAKDTLLVALSGHGVFLKDKKSYFCPVDAKLSDNATLICITDLYQELTKSKAVAKFLLVDACRDDPLAGGSRGAPELGLESVTRPVLPPPPEGVAAFFSCMEGQKAYEDDELKHGVFFNFVIEGLKGEAAADEGEVTFSGLKDFVTRRVRDYVRAKRSATQTPDVMVNYRGEVSLARQDGGMRPFRRGLDHLEKWELERAIVEFGEAIRIKPRNALAYAKRGDAYRKQPDEERALEDLTEAIRLDGKFAEAYCVRGLVYNARQTNEAAKKDFNAAIRLLQPSTAQDYWLRGMAYWGLSSLGNESALATAVADMTAAIQVDSKYYAAFNTRAALYNLKKEYDKAIDDTTEAIRINPRFFFAYRNRGVAHYSRREYEKAIADQSKAIEINPKDAGIYRDRALAYLDKKEYDAAIADETEAIRLDPKNASAYNDRGRAYYVGKKDNDQAIDDYTQAIRLDPKFAWPYNNRGVAYHYGKKDYDRAIGDYNQAIVLDSKNATFYANRSISHDEKKDYDRAIADLDDAIRLSPQYVFALQTRADIYRRKGDYDRAIADCSEAVRLDPQYASAYGTRGAAYLGKNDYDRGIADSSEAIRLNPKYAFAYANRGEAYRMKNDFDGAIANCSEAVRLDPQYASAYATRGAAYRQMGEFDKAVADLRKAVRINPEYSWASEQLKIAQNRQR